MNLEKFDYTPEHAPYDAKDPDIQQKIMVDKANWEITIERKLNEIIAEINEIKRQWGLK